jgi:transposase
LIVFQFLFAIGSRRRGGALKLGARRCGWKAQVRLCARYRRLATTAIAREIAAFLWAIGHQAEPKTVTSN